jgi:hypothetical protein
MYAAIKHNLYSYLRIGLQLLFWLPLAFFSGLLILNTIPYFNFSTDHVFIQERSLLFSQSVYKYSFYFHIAAGAICILVALTQFSSYILKHYKKLHKYSGRIYAIVVLAIAAPTGVYMSLFAKGGIGEKLLFMYMALSWFYFTAAGVATITNGLVQQHKWYMYRSYAMALTAITFRIYHIIFYMWGMDDYTNYTLGLWLSVVGNALIAELIIAKQAKKYFQSFLITKKQKL